MLRNNLISGKDLIAVPPPKKINTPFVMRYQLNGYKHTHISHYGNKWNPTPSFSSLFAKQVDIRLLWLGSWGYTEGYLVAKSPSWQDIQTILPALPAGWGFHTGKFDFWNSETETGSSPAGPRNGGSISSGFPARLPDFTVHLKEFSFTWGDYLAQAFDYWGIRNLDLTNMVAFPCFTFHTSGNIPSLVQHSGTSDPWFAGN